MCLNILHVLTQIYYYVYIPTYKILQFILGGGSIIDLT